MSILHRRSTFASTSSFDLDAAAALLVFDKRKSSQSGTRVSATSDTDRRSRVVMDQVYRQKLMKRQEVSPIFASVKAFETRLNQEFRARHDEAAAAEKARRPPTADAEEEEDVKKRHTGPFFLSSSAFLEKRESMASASSASTSSLPTSSSTTAATTKFSITHNTPLQLVIIIGSVVLVAMFVASLAWLCRASSREKKKKDLIKRNRKNTWSPGGPSSLYAYSSSNRSDSNLSMCKGDQKYQYYSSNYPSDFSPAPVLKMEKGGSDEVDYINCMSFVQDEGGRGIQVPSAAAQNPHSSRENGWQLYDRPVPRTGINGDVESAGVLPPARRPSFIDRLLAHRPNDARFSSHIVGPDNGHLSTTNDHLNTIRGARKLSGGSALLSALTVSLPTWPSALRSKDNVQPKLATLESDFEGTIGGRDEELPMAKRVRQSQGRFACDASTEVPTPDIRAQSVDDFSPLPNRRSAVQYGTPHSPGMAGLGSSWTGGLEGIVTLPIVRNDGSGAARPPTFAELQRQPVNRDEANRWTFQATIDRWVQGNGQYASRPPPPSRNGSTNSFLAVDNATPLVNRKCDTPTLAETNILERMISIRPHFAATTTLASWLVQEKQVGRDLTGAREAEDGIVEKYIVDDEASQASYDTDYDRKRGMLWETHETASSPMKLLRDAASTDEVLVHGWGEVEEEQQQQQQQRLEEERGENDRREKMLLKEKRKQDRRLSRKISERAQQDREADLLERARQQARMHTIVESEAPSAPLEADLIVAKSRRQSNMSSIILNDRPPLRAIPLSPPESPLTSASECSYRVRRAPGNFLVHSSKSRSSGSQSSRRSVSQGALLSMLQTPDPLPVETLSKMSSNRQHRRHTLVAAT
ncbi:hypothetical protein CBS101457_004102 [Exobasidium rhododendri]|nr:hypothetical protein CBS101457_004102 [Exobasidium rhododendri]